MAVFGGIYKSLLNLHIAVTFHLAPQVHIELRQQHIELPSGNISSLRSKHIDLTVSWWWLLGWLMYKFQIECRGGH